MLTEHIDELQRMSQILIQYETFDRDQFQRLLAGEAPEEVFKDAERAASTGGHAEEAPARSPPPARARPAAARNTLQSKPPDAPQPS